MGTILHIVVYTSKTLHIENPLALPSESKGLDPLKCSLWRPKGIKNPSHNVPVARGASQSFFLHPKNSPRDPKAPLRGSTSRYKATPPVDLYKCVAGMV